MDKEELIAFLKENLVIEVDDDVRMFYTVKTAKLILCGEVISSAMISEQDHH